MRLIQLSFIAISAFLLSCPTAYADQTSDIILNLLIKKGLITQAEVNDVKAEIASVATSLQSFQPPVDVHRKPMGAYWKNGFNIATPDEKFKLNIGARLFTDAAWIDEKGGIKDQIANPAVGPQEDNAEVREARIIFNGLLYEYYTFKIQIEHAGGLELKDIYFERNNIPFLDTLRLGQFKQPMGLENNTSKRFGMFMERPMIANDLHGDREAGVMLHGTPKRLDERLYWAAAFMKDINDNGGIQTAASTTGAAATSTGPKSGDYITLFRLTGLPWYKDEGRELVHLGMGYSYQNLSGNRFRFRARPEAHLFDARVVDTGLWGDGVTENDAKSLNRYNFESAMVYGPLSVQGEYTILDMNTRHFGGYYAEASYFITGENRQYDKINAEFGRVSPKKNFNFTGEEKGLGAWEVAIRYSTIDLTDTVNALNDVSGGDARILSTGVNWYLNSNMRLMLDYLYADADYLSNRSGQLAHIIQTRFQLDF